MEYLRIYCQKLRNTDFLKNLHFIHLLGERVSFQTQNSTFMFKCVAQLMYMHINVKKGNFFFLFFSQPLVVEFYPKNLVFPIFHSVKFILLFNKRTIHIKLKS